MQDNTISIYKNDGIKIMLVTSCHNISEVLSAFENVLKGSGYCFTGRIDIVQEDI